MGLLVPFGEIPGHILLYCITLLIYKNPSREDYTKILPLNQTENVNDQIPGEKHDREYPYSTNNEGKKLSVIPHSEVFIL